VLNRIALRTVAPVALSVLIHTGIAAILLNTGSVPDPVPALLAELIEAEAPPAAPPPPPAPRPVVREPRPLTPPRPVATPLPLPLPEPARIDPEPTPPPTLATPPEPPRTAVEPPRVPVPDPPRESERAGSPVAAAPSPTNPAPAGAGPSVTAVPEESPGTFTLPPHRTPSATTGVSPAAGQSPAVAAIPPDGGSVSQAIPRGGYQVRPTYPSTARNLGIQGTTLLHVLVSATGRVSDVVVKQSAGHPDLDRAATEAVRRWRFEPARRGTAPVEMWVQLPVEFKLR
jgi:protein TonB